VSLSKPAARLVRLTEVLDSVMHAWAHAVGPEVSGALELEIEVPFVDRGPTQVALPSVGDFENVSVCTDDVAVANRDLIWRLCITFEHAVSPIVRVQRYDPTFLT